MVDHGPFQRRGAVTTDVTQLDNTSTGLPQQSNSTSFANSSVGAPSGHDVLSGSSSLYTPTVSTTGPGNGVSVSYFNPASQVSSNDKSNSIPVPNSLSTGGTPGNSLPLTSGAGGLTKYFKMVGYYVTGAIYESFVVTGSPSSPTTTNPNTGHTLINTYVSSFWEL